MQTYIALIKGINVGGHRKVPMAELRELLSQEGLQNVQTYIQSGNVIFQNTAKPTTLQEKIETAIMDHFGFEVSVIVKTNKELQAIFDACPFTNEKKESSYFIMLNKIPEQELVEEAHKISYENEVFEIKGDCLYLFASKGYGKAKFNMNTFEKKLQVIGTARNYNTMVKLLSLSTE